MQYQGGSGMYRVRELYKNGHLCESTQMVIVRLWLTRLTIKALAFGGKCMVIGVGQTEQSVSIGHQGCGAELADTDGIIVPIRILLSESNQ